MGSHISNHREYNEGDAELGFTKYTFTLLFKFARMHRKHTPHYFVHLDKRGTPYSPEVTQITLNRRDAKEHGRGYDPYKLVHYIDSKDSRLIQVADLFTGIVAASWNRKHTASHKTELIEHARGQWNLTALDAETDKLRSRQGIDIWFLDWTHRKKA